MRRCARRVGAAIHEIDERALCDPRWAARAVAASRRCRGNACAPRTGARAARDRRARRLLVGRRGRVGARIGLGCGGILLRQLLVALRFLLLLLGELTLPLGEIVVRLGQWTDSDGLKAVD